ncbi:MAG: choice-of-anchor tandem repeat GloVer-containing protein [Chryseolinea sp.]
MKKIFFLRLLVAMVLLTIKTKKLITERTIYNPLLALLLTLCCFTTTKAQERIFNFDGWNGSTPYGSLIQATDGYLYGMTNRGDGVNYWGTIFKIKADGSGHSVLHNFKQLDANDGSSPYGSLIQAADGYLYGMTIAAGNGGSTGAGTIFKIKTDGTDYSILFYFHDTNGGFPLSSLIQGSDGLLYGMTQHGGSNNVGTIFKINTDGTGHTILQNFNQTNGGYPIYGSLTQGSDGTLYGMTSGVSLSSFGIIFKINTNGSGFTILNNFNGTNGKHPYGSLIFGEDGLLYGMTSSGGLLDHGTIFKIRTNGNEYTILHNFNNTDGASPFGSLIQLPDGSLSGMTYNGGSHDVGTVFKINPDGTGYTVLSNFDNTNGAKPYGSLLQAANGTLYGMTSAGGTYGLGTIFKTLSVSTPTIAATNITFSNVSSSSMNVHFASGNGGHHLAIMKAGSAPAFDPVDNSFYSGDLGNGESVVYNGIDNTFVLTGLLATTQYYIKVFEFNATSATSSYLVANAPIASQRTSHITKGAAELFGLTATGGSADAGTIFKINSDGSGQTKVIYNFRRNGSGEQPFGSLIHGPDSSLYGMTSLGGISKYGTIFKINKNGSGYTVLHNFDGSGGAYPKGSLTLVSDSLLFGMTNSTIFKIKLDGSDFHVLRVLDASLGHLIQASDGKLYGVSLGGGSLGGWGTIFKMNSDGNGYTELHSFDGYNNGGGYPIGSLIQAADGMLYGMTAGCVSSNCGTIFKINTDGSGFTILHRFPNGVNSASPFGELTQGPDGLLFGLTSLDGLSGMGTIFSINSEGSNFSVLHNFDGINGAMPLGSLIVLNEQLLGFTHQGGQQNNGVVFNYNLATGIYEKLEDLNETTGKTPWYGSLLLKGILPSVPTKLPGNISFGNISPTSISVKFTPGNGSHRLVVMKAGSRPTFKPVNDVFYSGNLDNGESVVYNGMDSAFNVTMLLPDTEYYITIFEFNQDKTNSRYLIDNAPVAGTRTMADYPDKYFSLIYFRSGTVVSDFSTAIALDVADPEIEKYSIRANGTDEEISSVKFTLDGVTTNIDNTKPYTISHWLLPVLSEGVHTISAQAYSRNNAHGEGFEIREAFIYVTSSAAVTQFDIVDGDGNKIKSIFDGEIININQPELESFNVVARTNISTTRSVKFTLNDVTARIDNRAPYGVSGKANGNEKPWLIGPGNYTLTATPFMKYYAWGPQGVPLTIHFSIVDDIISSQVAMGGEKVFLNDGAEKINQSDLVLKQVFLYPVPVKDELQISLNDEIAGNLILKIVDMNGKTRYTQEGTNETFQHFTIDTNQLGLSSGMYIIYMQYMSGKVLVKKFIKE